MRPDDRSRDIDGTTSATVSLVQEPTMTDNSPIPPPQCLVCGNPLPANLDPPICPVHFSKHLDVPRSAAPSWIFRHREGDRVLFRPNQGAGGTRGQGLWSAWRAVNISTRAVRTFPPAAESEVWLDLL